MKKNYQTPYMEVENFLPNDTVSSCPESSTAKQVTVACIITESHYIFYTGCSSNYNNLATVKCTDGKKGEDGEALEYLVWTDSSSSLQLTPGDYTIDDCSYSDAHTFVEDLAVAAGATKSAVRKAGKIHAGIITADIEKVRNQS